MSGRLQVNEFMVLTIGGVPIFHYSPDGSRKLDELLSGFLTAITSFASEFGERSVQSLAFEGSEVMYEQTESDIICIFLADVNAPKKILRAVLRDLSRKFMNRYSVEVEMDIPVESIFADFRGEVELSLKYYEGVLKTTSSLSSFVVPSMKADSSEMASNTHGFLDQYHRDFGGIGNKILETIDGELSIHDLSAKLGIEEKAVQEAVEYLAIWGVLRISKMCPQIEGADERFDAYLGLVGLPEKEYQLLKRAMTLCDGSRSLGEISEKLGVKSERLHEVLSKLGEQVEWKLVDVLE
ncbi:MAG: hypothetical protein AM324_012985 [Candidatus Thorarchaeota archaeon SMTZ1-83]|nr:MAG: hypothetical protein AM324_14170 [Candidatus Thorarchaeota archaeon SMTZ1-83]